MIPTIWKTRAIILSFFFFVSTVAQTSWQLQVTRAGDWGQLLGPNRDGQALGERPLLGNWKANPPKEIWRLSMGSGYAGAAIADNVAYLFDRYGGKERLTAVELATGKQRWQAAWKANYRSSMDPDSGPRAVPTVASGKVFCYGAAGDLVCVDSVNGKILWERPLRKELDAEDGYFGAGSSPFVVDGILVANIGGKKGGVVGIAADSGKTVWQATDYDASYSSPIVIDLGTEKAALVVTRLNTVLLSIRTGGVLGDIKFGARGPTVNAATPLPIDDRTCLLTASYGVGATLAEIKDGTLQVRWKDTDLLASQYNTPVKVGSTIIGVNGREDMGNATLRSLNLDKPEVLWEKPLPGPTHLIALEAQLLQLSVDGTLALANIRNGQLADETSIQLPPGIHRALPAYSNNTLIVRMSLNGNASEFAAYSMPVRN